MLTEVEANYLARLPKEVLEKPVQVFTFNEFGLDVAARAMKDIRSVVPELEIVFIGSVALRIAGQKDIDLSVLCAAEDFPKYIPKLVKIFGPPDKIGKTSTPWHFVREGYEVGVYITDPVTSEVKKQIRVYEILENNPILRKKYEDLKLAANGLPYREYQIQKYEFYHKILEI